MPQKCKWNLIFWNAASIISNTKKCFSSIFDFYRYSGSTCINGIFHQFFDTRRRPFNDFAGSDFIARRFI